MSVKDGFELVVGGDVGPDFEGVRAGVVVVPAVGAAPGGRDHDRAGARGRRTATGCWSPRTGCSWPTASAAAASGPQPPRRRRPARARRSRTAAAGRASRRCSRRGAAAAGRVVGALAAEKCEARMRSKAPALRHAGRPPGMSSFGFRLQLGEVDFGVERADVAAGERLRLRGLAPPGRVRRSFPAPGVPGTGSCALKRKATSKKAGGRRVRPGAAGLGCAARRRPAAGSCPSRRSTGRRRRRGARSSVPGFHSLWGTSTVIWRRARSTLTLGAGPGTGRAAWRRR